MLLFVPRRKRATAGEESGGSGGHAFLFRDALLGPLASVVVLLNAFAQMLGASCRSWPSSATATPRWGWLFAAYGLGGLDRYAIAFRLVKRMAPLTLASLAALGFALPFWVLVPEFRSRRS